MQSLKYTPLKYFNPDSPADVLIVGGHPTVEDQLELFTGEGMVLLTAALELAGVDLSKVAFTNVVKVVPESQLDFDTIYSWIPSLWSDLMDTTPRHVIALGDVAHHALVRIGDRLPSTYLYFFQNPEVVATQGKKERAVWVNRFRELGELTEVEG